MKTHFVKLHNKTLNKFPPHKSLVTTERDQDIQHARATMISELNTEQINVYA